MPRPMPFVLLSVSLLFACALEDRLESDDTIERLKQARTQLGNAKERLVEAGRDNVDRAKGIRREIRSEVHQQVRYEPIPGASDAIACTGDECTIKKEFVKQLSENPGAIAREGVMLPTKGDEGTGLRLTVVPKGSIPQLLGFQVGDLVTHLNGHPIDSMDAFKGINQELQGASTIRISFRRGADTRELSLQQFVAG